MGSLGSSRTDRTWWKDATVYQIYPASFKDSNCDGIGDIGGIISKLDYICGLGVDAVWVSPFFDSPQDDLGYDISNYEDVYRAYGTVADVQTLIDGCHTRGMRILLDLVVNHTSSSHPWFQASRASKNNPKREWCHWRPAKYDQQENRHPPNNWRSNFKGSAWEWDDTTQEYYLHLFAATMPDLNWECADLRKAVYDSAMRFWLDKGIDGFRIDTMTIYAKDPDFPDAEITDPTQKYQLGSKHYRNLPRNYDFHQEFNEQVLSHYGDLLTVGEFGNTSDLDLALKYVSASEKRVGMGFQFETVLLGYQMCEFDIKPFTLVDFKRSHTKWQKFIEGNDGWTSMFLENHDVPRSVSRFGCDRPEYVKHTAKMLATLQATSTGTLFLYQGQEIGMTNIPVHWPIEEYKDVNTQNYWNKLRDSKATVEQLETAMRSIQKVARDNARTPMQWDDSPHGGFTTGVDPWMRVNDNYFTINVNNQSKDMTSVLSFWKSLLALRKEYIDLFAHGTFHCIDEENQSVLSFMKKYKNTAIALVVCNFTASKQSFTLADGFEEKDFLLTTSKLIDSHFDLKGYEARVYIHSN